MDTKISHLNVNVQVHLAPPANIFALVRNISEGGESVVVLQSTTMEDYSTIFIKGSREILKEFSLDGKICRGSALVSPGFQCHYISPEYRRMDLDITPFKPFLTFSECNANAIPSLG